MSIELHLHEAEASTLLFLISFYRAKKKEKAEATGTYVESLDSKVRVAVRQARSQAIGG